MGLLLEASPKDLNDPGALLDTQVPGLSLGDPDVAALGGGPGISVFTERPGGILMIGQTLRAHHLNLTTESATELPLPVLQLEEQSGGNVGLQ